MLKRLLRKNIENWLDGPRPKKLLAKALRAARRSMDHLRGPIVNSKWDFEKDRSLYPTFAAKFTKLLHGMNTHPHYAWGALQGASLAKAIGVERVSMLEFGVAGGKGLHALEKIALRLEEMYGVGIDVYGFDAGSGLPMTLDYRDLPNLWSPGYYAMDQEKLKGFLKKARLVVGDVKDTVPAFLQSNPAPIAFVAFDLDFYTSTKAAFRIFDAPEAALMPRIHCYFDDINGFTAGEHNGERLAIHEFNESHEMRKISHTFGLKYFIPEPYAREMWVEMIFMAHMFDHALYSRNDGLVRGSSSLDPLNTDPAWTRVAR